MSDQTSASLFPLRRERPLTCLANPSEIQAGPHSQLYNFLKIPPADLRRGRKFWEFDYLAECAEKLGFLHDGSRGLGLGVGREALMFYFARKASQIVATDLYSESTQWGEARAETLNDIYGCAPFEYPRERLSVEISDMRKLRYPDASFDFIWSCGSIEHVNSLYDVYLTLKEAHRVLKPGGCALMTTEYCLSEPPYLFPSMNTMDPHLVSAFLGKLGGFELQGAVDLSHNFVHPICAVRSRQHLLAPCTSTTQQFAMSGDYVHMMGLSAILPIGFVLKRTGNDFSTWEALPLDRAYRIYTDAQWASPGKDLTSAYTALLELANSSTGKLSRQFHLQIAGLMLQQANEHAPQSELATMTLKRFLDLLPAGELQDANLISYAMRALSQRGERSRASELARAAARSPSAFPDHALSLALMSLGLSTTPGEADAAKEVLSALVDDLLVHGYSLAWINARLQDANQGVELPAIVKGLVSSAASGALEKVKKRML